MLISATELKSNMGKYLQLAAMQDIYITKNGKSIAKLTSPDLDHIALLDNLADIAAGNEPAELKDIKQERLDRQ